MSHTPSVENGLSEKKDWTISSENQYFEGSPPEMVDKNSEFGRAYQFYPLRSVPRNSLHLGRRNTNYSTNLLKSLAKGIPLVWLVRDGSRAIGKVLNQLEAKKFI